MAITVYSRCLSFATIQKSATEIEHTFSTFVFSSPCFVRHVCLCDLLLANLDFCCFQLACMPVNTRADTARLLASLPQKGTRDKSSPSPPVIHAARTAAAAAAVLTNRKRDHLSYRQAAVHYDLSISTVQRAVKRLRSGEDPEPPPAGARTALSLKEDRLVFQVPTEPVPFRGSARRPCSVWRFPTYSAPIVIQNTRTK